MIIKWPNNQMLRNDLKTKEDIQKWINDNNIDHITEIKINHKDVYYVIKKLKLLGKLSFPNKPITQKFNNGEFEILSDFQEFINKNNIKDRKEFRERYKRIYNRFIRKIDKSERNNLLYIDNKIRRYNGKFNTAEEYNEYLTKNNINSPRELRRKDPSLYDHLYSYVSKEERNKINWKNKNRSWSNINTIEEVQNFIIDNYVLNKKELHKRFPGLYVKFQNQLDNLHFFGKINLPLGEKLIITYLIKYGLNFSTQKTYPDLKNKGLYRFDVFLIDKNILIEHQGEGHFGKGRYYSEDLIKSDKEKYEFAKNNNIKLIYFTIYKSEYKNLGYFTKVLTEIGDLMLELGIDINNDNPIENWEEKIKEYFLDDINYYQEFIKTNSIIDKKQLKDTFPSIYSQVNKLGFLKMLFNDN